MKERFAEMGEIFVHESPRPTMATTGERLTAGHLLETDVEHFHRYYLARHFVRGKAVLDIASGEGYGAAILAQVAASVLGVDIAEEAVAHAAASYSAANLSFRQGDACAIPAQDAAFDVVTSFETIEHFYDHDAFLREIRRVLRPGGLLLLSSPNRDIYSPPGHGANEYHVRELTSDAFYAKCRAYFPHIAAFSQSALVGSVIMADRFDAPASPPLIFERRGERQIEMSEGTIRARYCLCIASDRALPPLPGSLMVHRVNIEGDDGSNQAEAAIVQRDREIRRLQLNLREAVEILSDLYTKQVDIAVARRDRDVHRLEALLLAKDRRLAESIQALDTFRDRILSPHEARQRDTEAALAQARAEAEATRVELAELRGRLAREEAPPARSGRSWSLRDRLRWRSARLAVQHSKLFQADWYLARYPDVRDSGIDPATHYVRFGAQEGRDPGPQFSTLRYLQRHPDVGQAGLNPLAHYERVGRAEGREIFPPLADSPSVPVITDSVIVAEPAPVAAEPAEAPGKKRRIVYISGESHTPGHAYRVDRYAEAARALGAEVTVVDAGAIAAGLERIGACDLLVIWRAAWDDALERAVQIARDAGAKIRFDVDDLMFEPALARADIIDGIRSLQYDEAETAAFFGRIALSVAAADSCSAPTEYLAARLRRHGKPAFVLPNGFTESVWQGARLAVRRRAAGPSDGLIRIGYATGTRTHQKDFAVAAGAVGALLRRRDDVRLVLFRKNRVPCLDIHEFPELDGLGGRIEWRDMVAVDDLPAELARFDVSIAPLEPGNPFCEAKSELKFFESALVQSPVVATPTHVFRAAIRHGQTGFLADSDAAWRTALDQLVEDATLRQRIGRAAYFSALWAYGSDGRAERLRAVLAQELGAMPEAAREFELELYRKSHPPADPPEIPAHEAEIIQDRMQPAAVTVVVPLYNYAHRVLEALDSVRAQSLETLDLVVVDDRSTDESFTVARDWMLGQCARFNRLVIVRNGENSGLGWTRNVGFAHAETPFVIPLDADNRLLPAFAARCLEVARQSGAAFVYSMLEKFGDEDGLMGVDPYSAAHLAAGNYIDALTLVRLSAWAVVGGYGQFRLGWEDYDLWCRFAERGLHGQHVPEVLAQYRVHGGSMLRTVTDIGDNKRRLILDMHRRHPWALTGSVMQAGLAEPTVLDR